MKKEPSILDYLKSAVRNDNRIDIGDYLDIQKDKKEKKASGKKARKQKQQPAGKIQWQLVLGSSLALAAQFFLEPDDPKVKLAVGLYGAAGILLWKGFKGSRLEEFQPAHRRKPFSIDIKLFYFTIALTFMVAAFLAFSDNTFTWLNLSLWITSIVFFLLSVWEKERDGYRKFAIDMKFIPLFLLVLVISAFYRFYLLNQVPGEMFSDHAEKLLDVMDVLYGKTSIYFTRNTGREPLQFYLTALVIKLFDTGISFLSLKIGTAFAGVATLVFIYLLGRQLANRWVGLIAMFLAGIAYWPNVISRVALRFTLYPLFAAPVMYFLFKGLQEKSRNDLVLCGLFLGLGLHGYSPARILPVYVVLTFLIFWLHQNNLKKGLNEFWALLLLAFASFIIFLPLFRYFLGNPQLFNYRAMSRLTSVEHSVPGSGILVFLSNFWKAGIMFFYKNGQIWVHSIPNRPALDIVSAGFLFVGSIFFIKRYLTYRKWEDAALLIAIPVLMLPSTLSLAFPNENPSLNRTGGAIVPVFLIAAIGFYECMQGILNKNEGKLGRIAISLLLVVVLAFTLFQNYDLVFNQYADQFLANAWNTTEIGRVIAGFVAEGNSYENAFVIPYPHWVDTRLVGINAGFPWKDYAIDAEDLEQTLMVDGRKLFILKPEDSDSLALLEKLYPQGHEEIFYSKTANKNFIMYSVAGS